MADLTAQQKAEARQAFAENKGCPDCGGLHQRACNRVKRQVWIGQGSGAGTRVEAEYWPEWKQPGVIWPEDAFDPDDTEAPGGR
jgi:hypothetical protein